MEKQREPKRYLSRGFCIREADARSASLPGARLASCRLRANAGAEREKTKNSLVSEAR